MVETDLYVEDLKLSPQLQLFATIAALNDALRSQQEAFHHLAEIAKRGDKLPDWVQFKAAENPARSAEIQEPPVEVGMKNSDIARNLFRANPVGLTCKQASDYLERHIKTIFKTAEKPPTP